MLFKDFSFDWDDKQAVFFGVFPIAMAVSAGHSCSFENSLFLPIFPQ
jgi:hypothetical protein